MKPKISIVTLGVRDFAKSLAFYREGLGFAAHNHTEGQEHVMFQLEGSWLSLFPRGELAKDATVADDGQGFSGVTLAHNVGSKEEVDAVFSQAGTPAISPTRTGTCGKSPGTRSPT
jgi:catechol 2,3-dioxygenase-like lactoylglutathione lyase family enzyme